MAFSLVLPGTGGMGGLQYVIKTVAVDYDPTNVAWDWLLGRLYALDRLLSEFINEFIPKDILNTSQSLTEMDGENEETMRPHNYDLIVLVAKFAVKAFTYPHQRICKMARRVFVLVARFCAPVDSIIKELDDMLGTVESNFIVAMRKKLNKIVEDFRLSERIVHELQHGCKNRQLESSPIVTPADTPISTPRCNSPVTCLSECQSEAGSITHNPMPSVPPNTPKQNRTVSRIDAQSEQNESADVSDNEGEEVVNVVRQVAEIYSISEAGGIVTPPYTPEHTADNEAAPVSNLPSKTMPTAPIANSPSKLNLETPRKLVRANIEHPSDILNNNEMVYETVSKEAQHAQSLRENGCDGPICKIESNDVTCGNSANLQMSLVLDVSQIYDESLTENDSSLGTCDQPSTLLDDSSAISYSQVYSTESEDTKGTSSDSLLDDDQGAMSSDDLLDLNSSLDREEQNRLVTFHTEIALTGTESIGLTEHKGEFSFIYFMKNG